MYDFENLAKIKKVKPEALLAGVRSENESESVSAGLKILKASAKHGLSVRDYLRLAVEGHGDLNGYEASLEYLNLPLRDDFDRGVMLQAAADTFQTFPGSRALFPEVFTDMVTWGDRQPIFEDVTRIVSQTRNVPQTEAIVSAEVPDDSAERGTHTIAEGGRIPVRAIRMTENTVKFFKHGSGIETTYEFGRRATLDILRPFANRVARELMQDKMVAATAVLVNGDGVNPAADVVTQGSFDGATGVASTAGTINWDNFLYWLVQRAQAGVPVDTVLGNYDSWFKWNQMFGKPNVHTSTEASAVAIGDIADSLRSRGFQINQSADFRTAVTFEISSGAPASQLIGFTKGETLEELVEIGSQIEETERVVKNQTINYYKTENTGYKLAWGDTREIYDYSA